MIRRIFHLLFDDRYVALRRWRPLHLWFAWTPYIGGSVNFNIQLMPPHKARFVDEDDDISWGPEFRFGADLLWVSFGFTIPNDDHPDNDLPKRYCGCGRETNAAFKRVCAGCHLVPNLCTCEGPMRRVISDPEFIGYTRDANVDVP